MKRLTVGILAVWCLANLAFISPAAADSTFAFKGGTCSFWVGRRHVLTGNDKYTTSSVWACTDANTHSMFAQVYSGGTTYCIDTRDNFARCTGLAPDGVDHANCDLTASDCATASESVTWSSSD